MAVHAAASLTDALSRVADGARLLAGGTDYFPALGERLPPTDLVDISRIPDLRGVMATPEGWRIGGATTWTDILKADLPAAFDALKQAAREVGSVQIQNRGTVAGNLCNASPAADGVPPLLALDATVELASPAGVRSLPLSAFLLGPRKTALGPEEMLTVIHIPALSKAARSSFVKLGARRYLVISIAMVAVLIVPDDRGRVGTARVAVGAASPVARRLPALEAALTGQLLDALGQFDTSRRDYLAPLAPIDDVRGSAEYRLDAVPELVSRALARAGGAGG